MDNVGPNQSHGETSRTATLASQFFRTEVKNYPIAEAHSMHAIFQAISGNTRGRRLSCNWRSRAKKTLIGLPPKAHTMCIQDFPLETTGSRLVALYIKQPHHVILHAAAHKFGHVLIKIFSSFSTQTLLLLRADRLSIPRCLGIWPSVTRCHRH